MEQQPKLKCGQCYREITVAQSLEHRCPKLVDLLQAPLTPETVKEETERKREIRRREAARKEIELKNEFKIIQREEKWEQKGRKPRDKKKSTTGQGISEIIKETRAKWGIKSYEKEKPGLEERKKQEEDFLTWKKEKLKDVQ